MSQGLGSLWRLGTFWTTPAVKSKFLLFSMRSLWAVALLPSVFHFCCYCFYPPRVPALCVLSLALTHSGFLCPQDILSCSSIGFGVQTVLCCQKEAAPCSLQGVQQHSCPLPTRCKKHSNMTTKNVPRHCQMFPEVQNYPVLQPLAYT